jgi:DNA-binding NtrC family response regulator
MNTGDIWLIDDDDDDYFMIQEIFRELNIKNNLVGLAGADQAMVQFSKAKEAPFLVLCDLNLSKISGFELREKILEQPGKVFHSVPFIYWSTYASEEQVQYAYDIDAHGFFIKEHSFEEMKISIKKILDYWQCSRLPKKK